MEWFVILLVIGCMTFLVYRYFIYRSKVGSSPEFTKRRVVYLLFLAFSMLFGFASVLQNFLERIVGTLDPNYQLYSLIGFSVLAICTVFITVGWGDKKASKKKREINIESTGDIKGGKGGVVIGHTTINNYGFTTSGILIVLAILVILWFIKIKDINSPLFNSESSANDLELLQVIIDDKKDIFDVRFRNKGENVVFIKNVHVDFKKKWSIYWDGVDFSFVDIDTVYQLEIPEKRRPPFTIKSDISQEIKSNSTERFGLLFKTPLPDQIIVFKVDLKFFYNRNDSIIKNDLMFVTGITDFITNQDFYSSMVALDSSKMSFYSRKNEESLKKEFNQNLDVIHEIEATRGYKSDKLTELINFLKKQKKID